MEVLIDSDSPILISNAEVMSILDKKVTKRNENLKQNRRKQRETKTQHRDWIEEKVCDYLKNSPCASVDLSKLDELHSKLTSSKRRRQQLAQPAATDIAHQTPSASKTTSFGLTEAEAIQIANFMPTEPVEIHLMVEELHDRMTESNQEELLKCIASYRKDAQEES
jgi:DNA-directed RNA polymerase subunit F